MQTEPLEDLTAELIESGQLVKVSEQVVFDQGTYSAMVEAIKSRILDNGHTSVSDVRDHFGTTRKYALPLLEHLDSISVTYRDGDLRRLR